MGKRKVSITIDDDLLEWIKREVKRNRFASISHAAVYALRRLKESEEQVER
jgi:Arc/MetJ-type ribon-helix-helix transcriptional regulator